MTRLPRLLAAGVVLAAVTALSACAGTVSMDAAPNANDPACADVSVRLPQTIAGESRRWTDAQATGAWGDPSTILLTCGVAVPGPSTLSCETVEGVDWLVDGTDAPFYRFTTFGRTPAVEVYLDFDVVGSADTLRAVSPMLARQLAETGSVCTDRPATDG
ncbi:uncharacterized protein DUF3515 [Microbacterium sp. AG1240]|uniref:DUF3515 family protein n=1 Tax=Microbacterium sp. AG1240 TaxID=2183992 RepID=UPI000EB453BF|nr:DUF3515 family protein [Microbacterium sp. AG1240]RKT36688.1 uncharacterized protein DUF3515 [Microbacterium sp. AG1240]